MSKKGSSSRRDGNHNYLRSQSMVPELEQKLSDVSISTNTEENVRSISSERSRISSVETNFKINSLNTGLCTRPDNGGTTGRQTVLTTNFYDIDIDFTKGAYHYDVDIVFVYLKKNGVTGESSAKRGYKNAILQKAFRDAKIGLYAFDGDKNVYTVNKIDLNKVSSNGLQVKLVLDTSEDETSYRVKLKLAATINLKVMKDFIEGKISEMPKTAINLLNLVIKQDKLGTHKIDKNSVYNLNGEKKQIGGGLYYVIGQYLSIKPCLNGWKQNCDMDAGIFYKAIMLENIITEIIPRVDLRRGLDSIQCRTVLKEIKGLKIESVYTKRKYNVMGFSKLPANQETFPLRKLDENGDLIEECLVTVADYFKNKFNQLRYPQLPCLRVGNPNMNTISLPIEVCKIVEGQKHRKLLNPDQQKNIAKGTVLLPSKRAEVIDDLMRNNVHDQNYLKEFGIICCNKNKMNEIKARVLKPPNVYYRNQSMPRIDNGKWRMANNFKLYETPKLEYWMIVWIVEMQTEEDYAFYKSKLINGIIKVFPLNGLQTSPPKILYLPKQKLSDVFIRIRNECGRIKPQLVMFVFNESDERDEIKKIAENDKSYGLMTQCIKFDKFSNQMDHDSVDDTDWKLNNYLSNVLLKINAKLGGCNNVVDYSILNKIKLNRPLDPVMFFGADVTHHIGDGLSVAAVVGSLDLNFTRYGVRLSEQYHEKEKKMSKEIITDLNEMAYLLIMSFKNRNNILPSRIVFYRDGVDEGQFQNVKDTELKAVKDACNRIQSGYSPLITIVIVQKRHNIRFFPINQNDMLGYSKNIPAGTVVDSGITSTNQFDFFLCSHETIQGTAQPTHYWVIHDENEFSSNEMQELTFMLCHLYVKSTKSVSIPAPVYYSHHAALRGRIYKNTVEPSESQSESTILNDHSVRSSLIEIHSSLKETMFFT